MLKRFEIPDCIEAGVDEAGRGCLMGRVYAAAVVMPHTYPDDDNFVSQIKDSKKLSEKKGINSRDTLRIRRFLTGLDGRNPPK